MDVTVGTVRMCVPTQDPLYTYVRYCCPSFTTWRTRRWGAIGWISAVTWLVGFLGFRGNAWQVSSVLCPNKVWL